MELRLDVTRQADVPVVRCEGSIVFGPEVDELRLTVLSLLKETCRVVLHLGDVDRIDSDGLAGIVGLFISARNRGGDLKLAHLSQRSNHVLRISRLDQVLETYDSETDAIASFPRLRVMAKRQPA